MTLPDIIAVERNHVGLRRKRNEDSTLSALPAFLVADGMGGHGYGDKASQCAIKCFTGLPEEPVSDTVVESLCHQASSAVADIAGHGRQPGTTMSGAILSVVDRQWAWLVLNIGDSRTYLYRSNTLAQVTTDHSRVQELVDQGIISAEQAMSRHDKNVITRAFGASSSPQTSVVDLFELPMATGDRLLICSDGLHGYVPRQTIAHILATPDINVAADQLVDAALQAGGYDNIGIVIVDVNGVPDHVPSKFWDAEDKTRPVNQVTHQ